MRATISPYIIPAGLLFSACDQYLLDHYMKNACDVNISNESCEMEITHIPESISRVTDQDIRFDVLGRSSNTLSGDLPLHFTLNQSSKQSPTTGSNTSGNTYSLSIPRTLRLGDFWVEASDGTRTGRSAPIPLVHPISYKELISFESAVVDKEAQALVSYLGFGSNAIFGLGSGTTFFGKAQVRQARRYLFQGSVLSEPSVTDYFLAVMTISALISTAGPSVYLSESTSSTKAEVFKCPARKEQVLKADCSSLSFPLPMGTQTMAVTPDEARMILADDIGALTWAALPGPVMVTAWKSIVTTGAGVRLAVTDLNGDSKFDILAVWGSTGNQQAAAYLATQEGFAKDPAVSMQLTTAIGQMEITALASGDMDNDGFGDLVIAQGQKLTVLQSQLDGFIPAWSASVAPVSSTIINAIAVGRLDATSTSDKPLDIVTASNSGYNTQDKNTLYLHAFRPQ